MGLGVMDISRNHKHDDFLFDLESESFELLVPCECSYYYGAFGLSRFAIVGNNSPAGTLESTPNRVFPRFSNIFYRNLKVPALGSYRDPMFPRLANNILGIGMVGARLAGSCA